MGVVTNATADRFEVTVDGLLRNAQPWGEVEMEGGGGASWASLSSPMNASEIEFANELGSVAPSMSEDLDLQDWVLVFHRYPPGQSPAGQPPDTSSATDDPDRTPPASPPPAPLLDIDNPQPAPDDSQTDHPEDGDDGGGDGDLSALGALRLRSPTSDTSSIVSLF